LAKKIVLIVGLGEVGSSLYEIIRQNKKFEVYCFDIDENKIRNIKKNKLPQEVDILHICYRYTEQEKFLNETIGYINKFNPKLIIINSTISPGISKKIYELTGKNLVHSPVRGMHQNKKRMKRDLQFWTKYIGPVNIKSAKMANKHFKELGLKTKILKNPIETELAKLFSTTYRAWMIACFQELHRISNEFKADFGQIIDFLDDTHRVRFDRPIHFPGVIEGHCLIANSELLLASYESDFIKLILQSNEKRKKEIKIPEIAREANNIRKKVEQLNMERIRMEHEK
jgi:UDP-N-acetyl-D-mannosaminuronate dehydrogenase